MIDGESFVRRCAKHFMDQYGYSREDINCERNKLSLVQMGVDFIVNIGERGIDGNRQIDVSTYTRRVRGDNEQDEEDRNCSFIKHMELMCEDDFWKGRKFPFLKRGGKYGEFITRPSVEKRGDGLYSMNAVLMTNNEKRFFFEVLNKIVRPVLMYNKSVD